MYAATSRSSLRSDDSTSVSSSVFGWMGSSSTSCIRGAILGCFEGSLVVEGEESLRLLLASGDVVTSRAGDMYELTGH